MAARKTDRVSAEMVEMALLLNKHEVLSAHDTWTVSRHCHRRPRAYTPERVVLGSFRPHGHIIHRCSRA
jgi:hypothetical protein